MVNSFFPAGMCKSFYNYVPSEHQLSITNLTNTLGI